nr:glycoside hydrolase/phage tail family protein [uncultured Jannaschia sp.]
MATLVLGAAGAAVGGSLGGSVLGASSAALGRAAGSVVGRALDQAVLGNGSDAIETGKLDRIRLMGASEGAAVPRTFGRTRIGGQVIWASDFEEHRSTVGGGKGGPARPEQARYGYSVSLAVALCEGEIRRVGRIWADGVEIAKDSLHIRLYQGSEDQQPDTLLEAILGVGRAPAFRGTAYVVIEDLDLTSFGNRVPQLSFEVVKSVNADGYAKAPADIIEGVALVPGTGEYALATTAVHYDYRLGEKASANRNSVQRGTDFVTAVTDLVEEFPGLKSVSLIVSWFGNDLRCSNCEIRPCVEQNRYDGAPQNWNVAGINREEAQRVPYLDDRPIYGGTPSDESVKEAIRYLRSLDIDITFYPFILMDQMTGNGLPDPFGDGEQASLPWRGRLTTELAPGRPGTSDRTSGAEHEVRWFFHGGSPDGWSYNRFIMHYAKLCAEAGGVEAFCIGSEMRSLTQIRGNLDSFPAVEELCRLASRVKAILPEAKLGYAADWSEYFGYHPSDTGNVHYHLDGLWAHDAINFIGIDNYMPLSDWRDHHGHKDSKFRSIYDQTYLKGNVAGGEGFDWYYPTSEHRDSQDRVAIADGEFGEDWIWKYKDLRNWWGNPHFDRIGGVRSTTPTEWVPRSKPIRFTEYGCAAIDKGTNQPNKFIDAKSSESSTPFYSNGSRDDAMQAAYHQALIGYWQDLDNNPLIDESGGRMVDLSHSFAWAWDTRPWPNFPEMVEFWSDGVNYGRGHWLTGRASLQPLGSVIAELCTSSGITSFDVSDVRGVLRGYSINSNQSARADLQPLLLAYGIEVAETAGVLRFFGRSEAETFELDADRCVRSDGPVIARSRQAQAETFKKVVISHTDDAGNFETKVASACCSDGGTIPLTMTELPLVLTSGEAQGIADRFLAELQSADETIEFSLPPSNAEVRVGSLVRFKGMDDVWRVDRIRDGLSRKIEAVRTDLSVYEPVNREEVIRKRSRPRIPLPAEIQVLDLPLLSNDHRPHAPYIAATANPWLGPIAVTSSIDDSDYKLNTIIETPSVIGMTLNELGPASPAVWDNGPEVLVRVSDDALESVTLPKLLAGANAVAIGDGGQGGWEIFQFQNARLVERRVWALSRRLRGQRGTEHAICNPWPEGSRIVFLDPSLTQLDVPSDALGLARHYCHGPADSSMDSPEFEHMIVAASGEGLKPYAPVHLRFKTSAKGMEARWIRRSRTSTEGWNSVDAPLAEVRERYLVRIETSDGRLLYEDVVNEPVCHLGFEMVSAWDQAAVLKVAQISDQIGPGYFATATLP